MGRWVVKSGVELLRYIVVFLLAIFIVGIIRSRHMPPGLSAVLFALPLEVQLSEPATLVDQLNGGTWIIAAPTAPEPQPPATKTSSIHHHSVLTSRRAIIASHYARAPAQRLTHNNQRLAVRLTGLRSWALASATYRRTVSLTFANTRVIVNVRC